MKILTDRGYTYVGYLTSGGEGDVHIIKNSSTLLVAKIVNKLDSNSFDILKKIHNSSIPNIPRIYEVFNHEDKTYIIREYIEGKSLYDVLQEEDHLSYERAKKMITQICETIGAFHSLKPHPIIYRDLKPDNIIITAEDDIRLIDFGIARYHKTEALRDTLLAGTRGYSAPEIMAGMQSDRRSDIYSIGLLFYEMLTGKNLQMPPFQVRPVTESNKELPLWLDKLIEKSTGVSMVTRFRDTEEFIYALNNPDSLKEKAKIKPWHLILTACFAVAVLLAVLLINQFNSNLKDAALSSEPTQSSLEQSADSSLTDVEPTSTPIPNPQDYYDVKLNLQFDDASDIDWILEELDYEHFTYNNFDIADYVSDGLFKAQFSYKMVYSMLPDSIFHIRVKPESAVFSDNENPPLFMFHFTPTENYSEEDAAVYQLTMESKSGISSEVRKPMYGYHCSPSSGDTIIPNDKWLDIVITLNEDGTEFKYYISQVDNDKLITYGGYQLSDEYKDTEYTISAVMFTDMMESPLPVNEVDFIKYSSGDISAYLSDNIPAYKNRKYSVDKYIAEDLQEIPISMYERDSLEGLGYELLEDIGFDSADDKKWIENYDDADGTFNIADGMLNITGNGIGYGINYNLNNDELVHVRLSGTQCTALALGPYRINPPDGFELIYVENDETTYTTWDLPFDGAKHLDENQFYDIILYTTPLNDTVYAIVADENTGKISYTAYNVENAQYIFENDIYLDLSPSIMNFQETGDEKVYVDFIRIARGSLEKYLQNNFSSYSQNYLALSSFFNQSADTLPDITQYLSEAD